jgi:hypothetical protein
MQQHNMEADITKLEGIMLACDANIKTFEEEIKKERNTIREWESFPEGKFPKESLERGIERCKDNIKTFEDAIEKEYETKNECRSQIDAVRERAHIETLKVTGLTIEVEKSDD